MSAIIQTLRDNPLVVLVLGLGLCVGSCVPFGLSIKHGFDARPAYRGNITPGPMSATPAFTVDTDRHVQVAVLLEIHTPSVAEDEDSADGLAARYHFPFEYTLVDTQGRELHHERRALSWDRGTRTIKGRALDADSGRITVETGLAKYRVPDPGEIRVRYRLEPDETHEAQVRYADLIVYERVYKHTGSVLTGLAMLLVGFGVAVVGVVLFAAAQTAPQPTTQAATSAGETPGGEVAALSEVPQDARNWATACHLSSLAGYFVPFGGLIAPLSLWLIAKERYPFADVQGAEAVNFRLSMYIYYAMSVILMFLLIGFVLIGLLTLLDLLFTIIAAVKTSNGEPYRYPLSIRFVKSRRAHRAHH